MASLSRPEPVRSPPDPGPREQEKTLVRDLLAGDEGAMEEFAAGYFPGLYRFALGRLNGDSDLARDIVQTTVCKVLSKLKSYRGEAPLFSWLCVCCRNEIAMHFRTQSHRPRLVELDERTYEPAPTSLGPASAPEEPPDRALLQREEARRVHTALDLLPPAYARALEWKYLDRLSVREIAARLERSPKATESLLSRARQAFRQGYRRLLHSRGPDDLQSTEKGIEP